MEQDKLDLLFKMQQELDDDIEQKHNVHFDRAEWIQKEVLAIMVELGEVLDAANYKWWKNPSEIDEAHLGEEIVDVLHFFISLCRRAGLSSDELFRLYCLKNEENHKRQDGTSLKSGYNVI